MAIAAILLASTAIFFAYLGLNGTQELDFVLAAAPSIGAAAPQDASSQSAASRWATGFSQ
jgi:hypothetical protein